MSKTKEEETPEEKKARLIREIEVIQERGGVPAITGTVSPEEVDDLTCFLEDAGFTCHQEDGELTFKA